MANHNFKLSYLHKPMKATIRSLIFCIPLISLSMCIPDKSSDTIESEKFRVNDPHSYAVPDQAVVKHLNWSAEVDFENRQIRGIAELLIEKAPNAEKLILDTKNLSIEKIALDEDDSTTYRLGKDDMHRGQALEIP